MNKLFIRRCLNFLLWISVCVLAGTGISLAWKIPHGPQRGTGYLLLGANAQLWKQVHLWVGVLFVLLVIAHMYMAWPWLKSAAAGRKRFWAVLAGILVGVSVPILFALSPVRAINNGGKLTGVSEVFLPGKGQGKGEARAEGKGGRNGKGLGNGGGRRQINEGNFGEGKER